jgi:tetratricopeptide (TPR) repeat protein
MLQLYTTYKELGKVRDAEKMIKQLIAIKKENKYRILYAGDLIEQKKYSEAKFITDEILKADPMNLDGLLFNGKILGLQKKYDDAMEALKMVSYVKENYAPAYYERAEIYRKQGEMERAEAYYTKALNFDPKLAVAELGLALIFKAQKKSAEYKKHLNKAKALDPNNKEITAEMKSDTVVPPSIK